MIDRIVHKSWSKKQREAHHYSAVTRRYNILLGETFTTYEAKRISQGKIASSRMRRFRKMVYNDRIGKVKRIMEEKNVNFNDACGLLEIELRRDRQEIDWRQIKALYGQKGWRLR